MILEFWKQSRNNWNTAGDQNLAKELNTPEFC